MEELVATTRVLLVSYIDHRHLGTLILHALTDGDDDLTAMSKDGAEEE